MDTKKGVFLYMRLFNTDIDECSNSSLHNCTYDHGLCNDVPGKFYCTCEEGYKFNDDETACVGKF